MNSLLAAESASALSFPILSMLTVVPAVGVLAILLVPSSRPEFSKLIAAITSVATAAMALWVLVEFNADDSGFQFVSNQPWIERWGIGWHLGVDGISLFLVALTGFLFPLVILGIDPHNADRRQDKPYFAWLLMLEAGMMGAFVSLDLFLFFVFFEVVLVPMYFLIGGWGYEKREYAANKFFLFTMFGSAFMLVSTMATAFLASSNGVGRVTFDLVEIADNANFGLATGRWLFFGFAIAFAIKIPIFPVHTWLPDAHTQAPTAGSVILAGVMLKLGTYGMLRFGLFLFPEAAYWSRHLWLVLGVIGILYGAIVATMQKDLKRLVAYSSVAHLGFIVLGTFAFTSQSVSGAVMQNINHGLSTGVLFMMVGMIYERRKTRQISDLKGLQSVAPIFAAAFLVIVFSSIGVPGLNGFIGEYLILTGGFLTSRWYVIVAATGVILAALYLLWAYQRVFQGKPDEENRSFAELKVKEAAVIVPFLVLIVFTGLYPKPMLDRIEPAVNKVISRVEERTDYVAPVPEVPEIEVDSSHGESTDGETVTETTVADTADEEGGN